MRTARPASGGTRARILDASRLLFNQQGVQATAVYKIAEALSISPGNLTYHFKTKGDIIAALADHLEQEIAAASQPFRSALGGSEFIIRMEQFLTILWNFRFLFISSHYLRGINEDLAPRHDALRDEIRLVVRRSVEEMIERRTLRAPRAPNTAHAIADNIFSIWVAWLQRHGIATDTLTDEPTMAILEDCMVHHFSILEPYLNDRFVADFCGALEKHYSPGHASVPINTDRG